MNYETTRVERASYGLFFVGQNIIYLLMLQFLNLFYTDVLGINAISVGVLFLVARSWDAINDPILGGIVDRCNFKGGKFMPWIKVVNLLLPLMTLLIFIDPNLGESGNLVYAYATYIIWGMVYTLCDVPIFALSTAMATNSNERVIILTWGRVAAILAGLIVASAGMPLIDAFGWTQTAMILCVIAMLVMVPIRIYVVERYRNIEPSTTIQQSFSFLLNHKPMRIFYFALLLTMGMNTTLVSGNYFAIYNLGNGQTDWVMPLMLSAFLPMLALALAIPLLIKRLGKRQIFIGSMIIGALVSIAQYFLGYDSIELVLVLNAVRSGALMLPLLLLGMFSADFVEYGQYHMDRRLEGITFSIQTFMTKLTQAIAAGGGGILLGLWGYIPNIDQSAETLNGIFVLFTLVPAVGATLAAWVMWKSYDLAEISVQGMIDEMRKKVAQH